MITIRVLSREKILELKNSGLIPKDAKIISICSSISDLIYFESINTYSMVYWDVTDPLCPGALSESEAKKLSLWIKEEVYDPELPNFELWIHCDAGISRSYATAEVIYELATQGLGREDFIFPLYRHPSKHANLLVRRLLMRNLENLIFDYTN